MKYVRTSRKNDVDRKGKILFGYDEGEEYLIYKFVSGEYLRRSEYKKIKKKGCDFNSMAEWRRYIRKKYIKCDRQELVTYIKHKIDNQRIIWTEKQVSLPIIIALFVSQSVEYVYVLHMELLQQGTNLSKNDGERFVYDIIIILSLIITMFILMVALLTQIHNSLMKSKKMTFYKEFLEVIGGKE